VVPEIGLCLAEKKKQSVGREGKNEQVGFPFHYFKASCFQEGTQRGRRSVKEERETVLWKNSESGSMTRKTGV